MKRFMQFSIGVLCLTIAGLVGFHLGNRSAIAQSAGPLVAFVSADQNNFYVMDAGGNVWQQNAYVNGVSRCLGTTFPISTFCTDPPVFVGNFWALGPVPTAAGTLGGVKSKYK